MSTLKTAAVTTAVSEERIEREVQRLFERLRVVGWSRLECELIAPLTVEINALKRQLNAVVLAHSYQTPDIIYGIADHVGDSLGLSQEAAHTDADVIVFCGVRFMAETARILSPDKRVLLPAPDAGCSLADSMTATDVRALRAKHPQASAVCYVNTSAEVKAECDACCTSANTLAVIEAMPSDEVIFVPDKLMAANMEPHTSKKLITWDGTCIVHEDFGEAEFGAFKEQYPQAALLAHTECMPTVVALADMAGSTSGMERYIAAHDEIKQFMLVTECGMTDKLKVAFPDRDFVGSCVLCPYMKKNELRNVLSAMKEPSEGQLIELDEDVISRARRALDRMIEIGRSERVK
jgi:quinolinate synthase